MGAAIISAIFQHLPFHRTSIYYVYRKARLFRSRKVHYLQSASFSRSRRSVCGATFSLRPRKGCPLVRAVAHLCQGEPLRELTWKTNGYKALPRVSMNGARWLASTTVMHLRWSMDGSSAASSIAAELADERSQ